MSVLSAEPTTAGGAPASSPTAPVHRRTRGLDVLRGLVVGWLLVVVHTPGSGLRGHARWFGWDHSDVFFPLFVLVAGMGLALQTRERVRCGRLLRRFVVLMVLGLLLNAWLGAGADLSQLRVTGVLQRIALAGLAGAVVVVLVRRHWAGVLGAALAVALGWGLLLRSASARPRAGGAGLDARRARDLPGRLLRRRAAAPVERPRRRPAVGGAVERRQLQPAQQQRSPQHRDQGQRAGPCALPHGVTLSAHGDPRPGQQRCSDAGHDLDRGERRGLGSGPAGPAPVPGRARGPDVLRGLVVGWLCCCGRPPPPARAACRRPRAAGPPSSSTAPRSAPSTSLLQPVAERLWTPSFVAAHAARWHVRHCVAVP